VLGFRRFTRSRLARSLRRFLLTIDISRRGINLIYRLHSAKIRHITCVRTYCMAKEPPIDLARCAEIKTGCTNFQLRKVARLVGAIYDETLRPTGLKGTQFNQLVALALMKTATVKRLARTLVVDRTSLNRSLAPLERDGLVKSLPGTDGRERVLELTSLGYRRLKKAIALWEQAQRRVAEGLGPANLRALHESLASTAETFRSE